MQVGNKIWLAHEEIDNVSKNALLYNEVLFKSMIIKNSKKSLKV